MYNYFSHVKQKNNKNERKMDEKLFMPHVERHDSVIEQKVRKFMLGFKSLEFFLSMGTNPDDEESLEFYSNLYEDMASLLTEITCFMIGRGYFGKRKRVDNSIFLSQKILGLLKILHLRYIISITSQDPISDSRWYKESDKSNQEIVGEISKLFNEMYSFKLEEMLRFLNEMCSFRLEDWRVSFLILFSLCSSFVLYS